MKTKIAFLSMIIFVMGMAPLVVGQHTGKAEKNAGMNKTNMHGMMMKPTYEGTSSGLKFTVWIMTREEHKKMMEGYKDKPMEMDKATKDAMMDGTHHMKLEVKDASTGKDVNDATVKVTVMSPAKMSSTVELMNKKNHYGGGLTLNEKGQYQFTINVTTGEATKTASFNYMMK